MASIDYSEAKKEIVKIFQSNTQNSRKILFWYDASALFKEDVYADNFDCCRILVCDKNEFSIKKTIEHDDLDSNFLVYIPHEKPVDTDNWLLDILCYSEEYYADTVALIMRRLELTNTDLRLVVERYSKFFDSEARINRLSNYVQVNDQMTGDDLKMAMLCVLTKSSSRSIESVLTELIFDKGTKYTDVSKFEFQEYLWDEISRYYNYEGTQQIGVLIRKFLFTALLDQKADFGELPSFYQQYIITNSGRIDAKFFVDKIKTEKRYEKLQESIANDLKIAGILACRDISCIQEADIFECIDSHVVFKIGESLKNGSLDYDIFDRVIGLRRNSIWYDKYNAEYEFLSSSIAFFRLLEKQIPKQLLATDYIQKYTEEYYLVDYEYRHACAAFSKIEDPIDSIEWIMERVELSYQNKFLDILGKEYSDALIQQKEWRFSGIPMTRDLYRYIQSKNYKKCIVIIADGFRYEMAHELYEMIQADTILKGSERISYAISPLPSETRFGMASLLPHHNIRYKNGDVYVDGQPTNSTISRDAIMKAKSKSYAAIQFDEVAGMKRQELRNYMSDKSLVYIYHNVIDNTGENKESKVFDVASSAIKEILDLIKKIFNDLQISNFFVTADHGFIYRRNVVEDADKYSNVVSMHPTEASKRYVIFNASSMGIPYTLEYPLTSSDDTHKVVLPYSYDLFKTPGPGLQYVHGGASLQEVVVPVIQISELSSAKNRDVATPVGVRIKSLSRKITNRSFSLDFEQTEKVEGAKLPVNCETYIVDDEGNKVSGTYPFVAASTSDDVSTRITSVRFTLMNIPFDRNNRYYLILRNADKKDESFIEKEQFVIDILAFKIF